eukprot:2137700-Prymnesium_polylepis.1
MVGRATHGAQTSAGVPERRSLRAKRLASCGGGGRRARAGQSVARCGPEHRQRLEARRVRGQSICSGGRRAITCGSEHRQRQGGEHPCGSDRADRQRARRRALMRLRQSI